MSAAAIATSDARLEAVGADEPCGLCGDINVVRYPANGLQPRPYCSACGRRIRAVVVASWALERAGDGR